MPQHLNVDVNVGSFDTYNPSLLWKQRLSERLSAQLSAEYMTTSGEYEYRYAKKDSYDTTADTSPFKTATPM